MKVINGNKEATLMVMKQDENDPTEDTQSNNNDEDFVVNVPKKRKPNVFNATFDRNFMSSPIITATADRLKLTNNALTMVSTAILKSGGVAKDEIVLSKTTMLRKRNLNRDLEAKRIKDEFSEKAQEMFLSLHWD